MVCASSMNRMIGCGLFLTSSITFFRRFSNSPLTLAPACSRPMSSTCSSTPCSGGGTSPFAMASARPSTTAVLPTPASPVRMGLFCRRRIKMSMVWRISVSRPITGSSLPSRARWVRLVVNWSSAGVLPPLVWVSASVVLSPAWASAPEGALAWRASVLPWARVSSLCLSSSTRTLANRRLARNAICCRPDSVISASMRWPLRMRGRAVSSEAISQACSSRVGRCALNTGVRVLPVLKVASCASRSRLSALGAMSKRWHSRLKSPRGCSNRASIRCSMSTSKCPRDMHRLAARSAAWRHSSLSLLIRVLRVVLMCDRTVRRKNQAACST